MSVLTGGGLVEPRRGGALWFLGVAVCSGLGAAWLAVHGVAQARREVPVLIARRELAPLSRIAAADVAVAEVPEAAVPSGALRTTAAAAGRFTRLGLVPGEIVTTATLAGGTTTASSFDVRLAALVADRCPQPAVGSRCPHLVAMSLPVSADQGYPLVRGGDAVDVLAAYPVSAGSVSQVIAADVPVLARLASGQAGLPGASGGPSAGWLILAVSPGQALRLQLAMSTGKLAVLLEPPGAAPEPPSLLQRVMNVSGLAGVTPPVAPVLAGNLPAGGGG